MTAPQTQYEAPSVEEIDAGGMPITTAAGLSGPTGPQG